MGISVLIVCFQNNLLSDLMCSLDSELSASNVNFTLIILPFLPLNDVR